MTDRDLPPLDDSVRDLLAYDRDPPPVDPALRARLRARIGATVASPPVDIAAPGRRRRLVAAVGFAAAAAAALIVASQTGGAGSSRGEIAATERRAVDIGDRATAIAEAGAALSWQVAGDGATEIDHTRGSVLYRVDPGARFVVHTPAGEIEVAGTTFRVEVQPMNRTRAIKRTATGFTAAVVVIVSVYEGIVLLRDEHGERELAAGQTAALGEPAEVAAGEAPGAGGPSAPAAPPELDYEADPTGELRLEGQVIDDDDQPVGDALVMIDARPSREILTEADGSFAFDRLPPRGYQIRARAGDRYCGPVTASLSERSEPVTLRLRRGSTLEVTVVDGQHRPVAGAEVGASEQPGVRTTTGGEGVARLAGMAPGFTEVTASAPGFAQGGRIVAIAGKPGIIEHARIELSPGAPLSGTVLDPDGKPAAGASVHALAASRGLMTWSVPEATTDAAGQFAFPALATGTYTLDVEHPEHAPGTTGPIAHDAARPTEKVEVTLGRGTALAGQVVTAAGQPAAFATLRLTSPGGRSFAHLRAVQADAAGRFRITGLPRAAIEVAATHAEGTATETIDLSAIEHAREVKIQLLPGQPISGVVVDASGAPVGDAQLVAVPQASFDEPGAAMLHGSPAVLTDQGGRFEITGLAAGAYQLRVTRPGRGGENFSLFRGGDAFASARAGDQGVKIVLPEEGSVAGKVVYAGGEPVTDFSVSLFVSPGSIPFSSPDGTFQLDEIPPGEQRLQVTAPGAVAQSVGTVLVEPGKTADAGTIVMSRGRTVSGRVVGSDGKPIEGARVDVARFLIDAGDFGLDRTAASGAETVTDRDGRFTIRGAGTTSLTIAARHPTLGLSRPVSIAAGTADGHADLVIESPGSIEGKVSKDGQPLAAVVSARALDGDVAASHSVQTEADGRFRFDRLAPGHYALTAQAQEGGILILGGAERSQATADVTSGEVARADIELGGKVTLTVRVVDKAGADRAALVVLIEGQVAATNGKQLVAAIEKAGDDRVQIAPILFGDSHAPPGLFDNIDPGNYTVCTTDIPAAGAGGAIELGANESAPVACSPVEVTATPDRQAASVASP